MKVKKAKKHLIGAKNSKEIAKQLGINSPSDIALMEYKALLSELAVKAIENSGMTVNELVKKSEVARSKVSAIKNGALAGISSDLFLKIISAAGGRITFKLAG